MPNSWNNTNRVISRVPIANHNGNIPIWSIKRNRNNRPVIDNKTTKTTWCSLKMQRREVKETPNLVLDLKLVSPVPLRRNGAICTQNSILPGASPLLNTSPETNKQSYSNKSRNGHPPLHLHKLYKTVRSKITSE